MPLNSHEHDFTGPAKTLFQESHKDSWRWILWFGISIAVFFLYRFIAQHIISILSNKLIVGYLYPIIYGAGALFLGFSLLIVHRLRPLRLGALGCVTTRQLFIGLSAVLVCYTACYSATFAAGYGREPVMMGLGLGMTDGQYLLMLASLIILPPIVEEIAFRQFLLASLPIEKSRWLAGIAVGVTAFIFYKLHSSYLYLPTQMLMLGLGLVFGWARVATGGLLLPIGMHTLAEVIGLTVDAIWKNYLI